MRTSVPTVPRISTYYTEYVAKRIRERRGGIPDGIAITEYHGKTYITEMCYTDLGIPRLTVWPIRSLLQRGSW